MLLASSNKGSLPLASPASSAPRSARRKTVASRSVDPSPPQQPAFPLPGGSTCPQFGPRTGSAASRPVCRRRSGSQPNLRWRWTRFEALWKPGSGKLRWLLTPVTAMTASSAKESRKPDGGISWAYRERRPFGRLENSRCARNSGLGKDALPRGCAAAGIIGRLRCRG